VSGLQLVVREFEAALQRIGVVPVPAIGEPFDPAIHEAIAAEEADDVTEDTVIDELVPGYRLHDRLLRPAIVRVARPRQTSSAS
jgi:molecular chaperone GrpE